MKSRILIPVGVLITAMLPVTSWLCRAGEVTYLETFDASPYPWVSRTERARFADWPNGDLSTAPSKGVLRAWSTFPPHKPSNVFASLKSILMNRPGEIQPGRDLELQADVLRLGGAAPMLRSAGSKRGFTK